MDFNQAIFSGQLGDAPTRFFGHWTRRNGSNIQRSHTGWLKSRAGKRLKFRRDEKGFALQTSGIEHQLLSI
jgi:hypothetical protein